MAQKAKITMDELLAQEEVTPIVLGDTIDGIVMSVKKHEILIDLGARGVGMVPRREVAFGRQLKVGDEVSALSAPGCDRVVRIVPRVDSMGGDRDGFYLEVCFDSA